jgi:hypothetical protein
MFKKVMLFVILGILLSAIDSFAAERVIFSIENRRVDGDDYLFDVYADIPDPSNVWRVAPETIVILYNEAGLSAYDYDGDNVMSFDSELSGSGYVATQTDYSDGMVSFNIVSFSPSVDKDDYFMLGTIKLAILDDTEYDDLEIETESESVIYNNFDELTYGCSTSSCWSAETITSQLIGGEPLGTPTLSSPSNSSTDISTSPTLSWNSVTDATSYDVQVSTSNTFSTTVVDDNVTSTSKSVSGLDYETTYYWRARALNAGETSDWSSVWSFTTEADDGEMHFSYTSTSIEMSIKIPADADLTLDGVALANGDEIGVFTQDGVCAGAVVWEEELVFFSVYGATSTPPADGFEEDEEMVYKVWDASENMEVEVSSVTHSDFLGNWINGEFDSSVPFKQLDELTAVSTYTQTINFVSGWNLFSSYIVAPDADLAVVMAPVEDDMVIMRNDQSKIYYPSGDYNQIGDFDNHDGYNAYFTSTASLDIEGTKITPEEEEITLGTGWSLVGYLRDSDLNIETALADIEDNLLIVRDGASHIYYPSGGYNTIGDMEPGKGYQMFMTTADALTYPANGSGKLGFDYSHQITATPEFLQLKEEGTGISSVLIIEDLNIPDGIEIGAFSKDYELFGSGIVFNEQTVLTIHGDNEMTEYKDGFNNNEDIIIKAFDPENSQYTEMNLKEIRTVNNNNLKTLKFIQNSVIYAKEGNSGETYFATNRLNVSPNPVNENAKMSISLKENTIVTIEIYAASGQKLHTINNGIMTRGIHEMQLDFADYVSGMYTIMVRLDNEVLSTNVIKVK